jgi:CRISPR-associated endonuclease/helicase Cas3
MALDIFLLSSRPRSSRDISYDTGYFEAAPIDALAQRMGRVNRKGKNPPALVVIASRPLSSHPIYDSVRTETTLDLLRRIQGPVSESDFVEICKSVYADGYNGEDLPDFQEHLDHRYFTQFRETLVAGDHESWVERVIDVEGRMDVLPETLLSEFETMKAQRRWLEADRLTVNIRANQKILDKYVDQSHDPWVIRLSDDEDVALPR